MASTLKAVFDKHLAHVKFNKALADALYRFQVGFTCKNEDHIKFFGGNLTGVQVVRWLPKETNIFFGELLGIDPDDLAEDIKDVPDINQSFKVSSDTFNLKAIYVIHRFLTSELINPKLRERAAMDMALLFNYRVLTGLMAGWFKYPANESVAKATYANLSYKFLLKKLGSWSDVLAYRAKELIEEGSLHYKRLISFDDDLMTVRVINDSQGRIKDLLKNIYAEYVRVLNRGDRIGTSTLSDIDIDGVGIFKDKVGGLEQYTNYILSVIHDKNSFVKYDLVEVVIQLMFTVQRNVFVRTLEWFSEHSNATTDKDIEKLIRLIMVHSYEYLSSDTHTLHNTKDLPGFLSRIRGVYLSSRTSDPNLLEIRELGFKLIKHASGSHSENAISSLRTTFMLYIVLRAYTKQYYTH